jgi:hypothetical protein
VKAILQLIFGLLADTKGKGKGIAVTRGTLLTLCGAILFCVRDVPEQMKQQNLQLSVQTRQLSDLDKRISLMELRLGTTDGAPASPLALRDVTDLARVSLDASPRK